MMTSAQAMRATVSALQATPAREFAAIARMRTKTVSLQVKTPRCAEKILQNRGILCVCSGPDQIVILTRDYQMAEKSLSKAGITFTSNHNPSGASN